MNSHWPILLAVLMVGAAGVYGFYMQSEYEQRAKVVPEIRTLPTKYSPAPVIRPMGPIAQFRPEDTTSVPQSQIQQPIPISIPANLQTAPATRTMTAKIPGTVNAIGAADRDAVFNNLRAAVSQRFGVQPLQTATGYAAAIEGARLEVDFNAWSIAIYNDNKLKPLTQSEGFWAILNLVAANLEMDLNAPANNLANGQVTRRLQSKLGRLSSLTDPAMNNSVVIRPLVKTVVQPAAGVQQNGNVVKPPAAGVRAMAPLPTPPTPVVPAAQAKPVKPALPGAPVQPVKPPSADQF